jgi:hypothetical protein
LTVAKLLFCMRRAIVQKVRTFDRARRRVNTWLRNGLQSKYSVGDAMHGTAHKH